MPSALHWLSGVIGFLVIMETEKVLIASRNIGANAMEGRGHHIGKRRFLAISQHHISEILYE